MYSVRIDLGHWSHMTWVILNVPANVPGQYMVVPFVWYIQNALKMGLFGIFLVHCLSPYNGLAMYWLGTLPLAPSDISRARSRSDFQVAIPPLSLIGWKC